jgi:transcriptional regulator with GAF, ATPase, and Fis domain
MDSSPPDARAARDAEHYRTLLEINNAIIANLTREALFHAIAGALQRVLSFERTAIFLHETGRNVLRLFVLEASMPSTYFGVGLELAPDESHVGWVFQHRLPLLRRNLATERQFLAEEAALADGVRSYVAVPMVVRGTVVGVLAVASTRAEQYSEADAAFLQEAANQVALAVENMKAYEDMRVLNEQLQGEMARRQTAEDTLRAITEGTASVTGSDFLYALVRHIAAALKVRYAFVTECPEGVTGKARVRAFWKATSFAENFEYEVAPTPCARVLEGAVSYYCAAVQRLFPDDTDLVNLGAESYAGVPLVSSSGEIVGHLAVLDSRPMSDPPAGLPILRVFAARAAAELERLRAEDSLRAALAEVQALRNRLQHENVYLQEEIRREHNFVEMVGSSPALLDVLAKVESVARVDSTVLVLGETGTGKELIARAIHDRSARAGRPLVKVNCSAISAGLVESELFGHVKGAFTGALDRRVGRFELADGGTIFLDEVGDLPLETQVKLLRVLQEREFEPVGSNRSVRVDVRVIAATNRDLEEAIRAGRFRSDLFYRLNVFPLEVPALRERRSDIPQLAMFFLARFGAKFGKAIDSVSRETMDRLLAYPWPGNIRELQNVIERAVVLAQGPVLELDDQLGLVLPPAVAATRSGSADTGSPAPDAPDLGHAGLADALDHVERGYITTALTRSQWVIEGPKGAAQLLKLHPNTLRGRMEKLGIKRPGHQIP